MREMIDFLTASSSWSGSAGIPERLAAHVYVSMLSMVVAGVIALPRRRPQPERVGSKKIVK